MGHKLTPFITEGQISDRVEALGQEVAASYQGDGPLVCICVLKGAFLFFADLIRRIDREIEVDFVRLASYGTAVSRGEDIVFSKDLEISIEGKDVLVIEDIVDTGHSMDFLLHVLRRRNPKSLKICALIDKHERRERKVTVDFAGFKLREGFIVGYGLDYAERYRELGGIYELSTDNG
ncbi:MAG: hypoxanthine phosphoribosyltransferase [Pseudodesulfovibrio sp.]|uniref:Hypoxanthine phosphoribosyltransferase n=1 Tax=Pseudodesulfovibrio aespoeensis (strain ATCC 700646 / DSM 10631 / Aspo-2) TaxID=643562 RepID=E6VR37_PSEA9|nr:MULTISPECIES: hypoxanthine phosphoribosyltransferase [Pseudodesulfovibrio]MBU4192921.1 hypoxanthine phosphoribosyltransferase [Pseudomonadota bacterium]ADU64121.1 hypoxanthine phosphoribosyltransferase [Pseudodesulfovibrio aespoeensis Aspo-2]MBU4245136.1 hypoxanthine phosphoribosyltransferase [Pseudomonadota bacterium]MBU4474487.1 hypoxanthine phosphoribosyltransferase [Pseudomonadota bacterium]MBU4517643.1 hypoxanthine phosphoribosyltransferase [Pseudomonadota bacterium]